MPTLTFQSEVKSFHDSMQFFHQIDILHVCQEPFPTLLTLT